MEATFPRNSAHLREPVRHRGFGKRDAAALAIFLGGSLLASLLGASSGGSDSWYAALNKPPWTPPGWLFGPVWTLLYVAMAAAAFLVWRTRGGFGGARRELGLYAVQLALNAAWSPLFFGAHRPGLALFDIGLLWLVLAALVPLFFRVRRAAGLLLVPYLAWVTFASALNLSIVLRN